LFVNKHNISAIRAYQRAGFAFEKDVITEIGGGFVMDDYVMVKML
ncbi:MAG: Ribosomal protein acetylase RimI, partial [Prosthecobacter sp.]|nr:Ribosomal protein acetylase RimI [Prosthecobacter sp.]